MKGLFTSAVLDLAKYLEAICARGPEAGDPEKVSRLVEAIGLLSPGPAWTERQLKLVQEVLALPLFSRDPARRESRRGYLALATMLETWAADAERTDRRT